MAKNVSKLITDHLDHIGRPTNLQGISSNLIDCSKVDVQKALLKLVEEEIIKEKTINKAKIYYINQKQLKNKIIDTNQLDRLIIERKEQLKEIENTIRLKETELKKNAGKLTKNELENEIKNYENEILEYENKIKKIEDDKKKNKINDEQYKKYSYEQVSKECRKRKSITKDIVETLVEFQNKKRKQILEDIGIEFYN